MFHMLSTTFASPVNIQHVPTIARSRGQHVVNICSSHPPSDGLAHESVENQAGEAQKSLKIVQKSLKIARFFHGRGPTGNIFNICKATGRINIQHCCQHLQRMVPTFQHQQLQRGRQRFPRWLPETRLGVWRRDRTVVSTY